MLRVATQLASGAGTDNSGRSKGISLVRSFDVPSKLAVNLAMLKNPLQLTARSTVTSMGLLLSHLNASLILSELLRIARLISIADGWRCLLTGEDRTPLLHIGS